MAARMSVHAPRKTDGCSSGNTSLYTQRKYARNTSAKWNISGVRNTMYTGTQVAPTNASANNNEASGVERATRNVYAQTQTMNASRMLKTSIPLSPNSRTNGAAATEYAKAFPKY